MTLAAPVSPIYDLADLDILSSAAWRQPFPKLDPGSGGVRVAPTPWLLLPYEVAIRGLEPDTLEAFYWTERFGEAR